MRKRRSEIVNRPESEFFALIILSVLLLAGNVSAQDGSGRSETADNKSAVTSAKPRVRTRAPKSVRRIAPKVPAVPRIKTGRLAVMVNEGGSQVHISRIGDAGGSELISVTSRARSLIFRTLPAGSYSLLVKKPGFFDDVRTIDIVNGKRRRAEINLRPMMARLTIVTNVANARIDIEKVGRFDRPVRKLFIRPDIYRLNVRRRGYVSFKSIVDLKIPGQEKVINVVLQPIRIGTILAEAGDNIKRGEYETAADLTKDVLLLNPLHAKANLLFGLIEFHRSIPSASSYLIKAVRKGETVTLPIKILEDSDGKKMVEAELLLNRDSVALRSTARFDLNYKLAASEISGLRREINPLLLSYIVLEGRSDFHGRPIEPHLKIYSRDAFLPSGSQSVSCVDAAGRSCGTAVDIIFKLLSDWRSSRGPIAEPG